MDIKKYRAEDVANFVILCKKAFPVHNIFDKDLPEIQEYLRKKDSENAELGGVFFAYDGNRVVGGALLRIEDRDMMHNHARFKYNHLVGENDRIKKQIVDFLDNHIRHLIRSKTITSAKIELGIAENESDLQFYLDNGFLIEGELRSHYRQGELVRILGKEITL